MNIADWAVSDLRWLRWVCQPVVSWASTCVPYYSTNKTLIHLEFVIHRKYLLCDFTSCKNPLVYTFRDILRIFLLRGKLTNLWLPFLDYIWPRPFLNYVPAYFCLFVSTKLPCMGSFNTYSCGHRIFFHCSSHQFVCVLYTGGKFSLTD